MIFLWQKVREDIFGIENGLLHTSKELWLRPGHMVSTYIKGATVRYYGPFKYLIFWTAVYLLSLAFVPGMEQQAPQQFERFFHSVEPFPFDSIIEFKPILFWFMEQHTNFYLVGIVPFLALSAYTIFRNNLFNFTELIIFYMYFCGQFAFCGFAINVLSMVPALRASHVHFSLIFGSYFYLFFRMHLQFFEERPTTGVLKGVGTWIAATLTYWLAIIIALHGIKYVIQLG